MIGISQTLDMVPHPNDQNWTTSFIFATKSILSRLMNLADNVFISCYFVWSVAFIPGYPLPPLFDDLFPIELPSYGEFGYSIYIRVEVFPVNDVCELFGKDFNHLFLERFDLCQLTV